MILTLQSVNQTATTGAGTADWHDATKGMTFIPDLNGQTVNTSNVASEPERYLGRHLRETVDAAKRLFAGS
jgi:hypothetical protein